MTRSELAAVVNAIAPVFREYVKTHVSERFGELKDRVLVLETKTAVPVVEPPQEIDPEDMAASVAGLLRKELDDLAAGRPVVTRKRIEKDDTGYTVTEEVIP